MRPGKTVFHGDQGVQDLREFTKFLTDRTSIPIAITSNHESCDAAPMRLYRKRR